MSDVTCCIENLVPCDSETVDTACAKKKKDILIIHIKFEGVIIFLQKFC